MGNEAVVYYFKNLNYQCLDELNNHGEFSEDILSPGGDPTSVPSKHSANRSVAICKSRRSCMLQSFYTLNSTACILRLEYKACRNSYTTLSYRLLINSFN